MGQLHQMLREGNALHWLTAPEAKLLADAQSVICASTASYQAHHWYSQKVHQVLAPLYGLLAALVAQHAAWSRRKVRRQLRTIKAALDAILPALDALRMEAALLGRYV